MAPWGERPGITNDAQWIWPAGDSSLAYCRKTRLADRILSATCDDIMTVYVDGEAHQDEAMQNFKEVSMVTIPYGTTVVAIECHNLNGPFGILGSTDDGILTDENWRCSGEQQDGWTNPDFDDSTWETPALIGSNGNPTWGQMEGISAEAQWMWSEGSEETTYCRRLLKTQDASSSKLEVATVDVETGEELGLFAEKGDHGDHWIRLALDLPPTERLSAIRLKGYVGTDTSIIYSDIALDDVSVRDGRCFEPTTTPAVPTTTTTEVHIPDVECNFEAGMCKWESVAAWVRSAGQVADHTTGLMGGGFAAVDFSSLEFGKQAKLQLSEAIQIMNDDDIHCLQFFYKLDSAVSTTLALNLQTAEEHNNGQEGTVHWKDGGARGQDWILGQYEVNRERAEMGKEYFLLFTSSQEFGRSSNNIDENLGIVYLDDITYIQGECPTLDVCTFESKDQCGWHSEGQDSFTWIRVSSQDTLCQDCPPEDHTYHTGQGHYMAVRSQEQETEAFVTQSALLISPQVEVHQEDWCLRLFFESYDDMEGKEFQVNIYSRYPGQSLENLDPLLSLTNTVYPNHWMPLLAPLAATEEPTEVTFMFMLLYLLNLFRLFWRELYWERGSQ
jgi:hypothetical protein